MKSCPTCRRLYPDDAGFCPVDGVGLLRTTDVPVERSDEDPRVGALLCMRYEIRRVVADGGMGRVYEALDLHDKAAVAVKVLHPDVARDAVSVARFKREFDVSKLLPHDHIVDVRDFAQTEDGAFALVMEYLDGEELRNVLEREKRLPPERVVRMLSQAAIGLDEAHRRQLVHRDLKPDNLFLCGTREGDIVKVLDFGSVKDKSSGATKLTVMGTTLGSPFYMAPEQAQGLDSLDARADVWALATIAYECVTGEVPFKGTNGPSILLSILTKEPPPPSEVGAAAGLKVPPGLDDVMEVALAKNPAIRTKSVGELADAVGRAYGLEGDHRAWAMTPQADLGARIAAKLPSLLVHQPAAPPPAFAAMDRAFEHSAPATNVATAGGGDEMFVMGVPKGPPKWLVPAIVGAVAVVLGVIGTVLLLR